MSYGTVGDHPANACKCEVSCKSNYNYTEEGKISPKIDNCVLYAIQITVMYINSFGKKHKFMIYTRIR